MRDGGFGHVLAVVCWLTWIPLMVPMAVLNNSARVEVTSATQRPPSQYACKPEAAGRHVAVVVPVGGLSPARIGVTLRWGSVSVVVMLLPHVQHSEGLCRLPLCQAAHGENLRVRVDGFHQSNSFLSVKAMCGL